ncbi:MAG: GNAT family N-acetyltransferase [Pseudomonadota bacterium]
MTPCSDLHYRRCEPQDETLLRRVAIGCYTPYYHDLWEPGGMAAYLESIYAPPRIAAELVDPNLRYEIAYLAGEPVGFSKYHFRCDRDEIINAAYLERVYVAPAVIGTGVGRCLIERMIDTARSQAREWIWLQAMSDAAKPLERYRDMGFTQCGQHHLELPKIRAKKSAMLVMRLRLTAE